VHHGLADELSSRLGLESRNDLLTDLEHRAAPPSDFPACERIILPDGEQTTAFVVRKDIPCYEKDIPELLVMASLYIKDSATADLVTETARRTGKTKTAVVREAVAAFAHQLPEDSGKPDIVEWWRDYRRRNPLGPPTGLKADKAFYDSLEEDGDDPE
jgi:antitoxin VapB